VAGSGLLVVVKVVIPHELLARGDVTEREKPDPALDLVDLAIRIAGMIEVSAEPMAVDDGFAVLQPVQVSAGHPVVAAIGFLGADSFAFVLDDASSFTDGGRRVHADGMNRGRANH